MNDISLSSTQQNWLQTVSGSTQKTYKLLFKNQIEDQEDADYIAEIAVKLKNTREELEKERLSVVKPLKKVTKKIDAWFKPTRDLLDSTISLCRNRIEAFEEIKDLEIIDVKPEKKKSELIKKKSNVSVSNSLEWYIKDFAKIPRKYLDVDKSALKIALREQGANLNIPGIGVKEKKQITFRK